jgi:hypothetical protein
MALLTGDGASTSKAGYRGCRGFRVPIGPATAPRPAAARLGGRLRPIGQQAGSPHRVIDVGFQVQLLPHMYSRNWV